MSTQKQKMQQFVNHYIYALDASGSMGHLGPRLVSVFDKQIENLKKESIRLGQETRVSVYKFNDNVENLIFDMDVMRCPSLKDFYSTSGNTSLVEAICTSIKDISLVSQKYGDHAFLVYTLTDGIENASSLWALQEVSGLIKSLQGNVSLAILVPNQAGSFAAKKLGIPAQNIEIWDTTESGLEEAGKKMSAVNTNFMSGRTSGVKGSKNLFNLDAAAINSMTINRNLKPLDPLEFDLFVVHRDSTIKPFAESWTRKPYLAGSCYYQLVKNETIGATKRICIRNKLNGKVYTGENARNLLKLPEHEVKVSPSVHPEYEFYVQSTSGTRKLPAGTNLIYLK